MITFKTYIFSLQRGPNKVPIYSLILETFVVLLFVFVGDVNTLAPIVTTAFMITYVAIDYAYFALAMSYDKRQQRELKFGQGKPYDPKQKVGIANGNASYGSTDTAENRNKDSLERFANDLDKLFPERMAQRGQHHLLRQSSMTSNSTATTPEADFDATHRNKSLDNISEHSDTAHLLHEKIAEAG